jgi:hypothetical protein
MIVLAYLASQHTKIQADGCSCWFLRPFIWNRVSGLVRFRYGYDKETARNILKILEKLRWRPWQYYTSFRGRKCEPYTESPNSPRPKKCETDEERSQEHAHYFVLYQGDCSQIIRPGSQNSQFRILLWSFTGTVWIFAPNFGDKRTGCWIMIKHHLTFPFSPGNFWPQTTWLSSPTHPTFSCFLNWRYNWKAPFWHSWGDRGRLAGGAERPHRTRLPGCT